MFDDFERAKFPKESCTIQNAREKGVKDSAETYLCVIVDKRWPNQCRLEHLRPYTARDVDGNLYFGWSRIDFDGWIDHITAAVHGDPERVVAWKKVEAEAVFANPEDWG